MALSTETKKRIERSASYGGPTPAPKELRSMPVAHRRHFAKKYLCDDSAILHVLSSDPDPIVRANHFETRHRDYRPALTDEHYAVYSVALKKSLPAFDLRSAQEALDRLSHDAAAPKEFVAKFIGRLGNHKAASGDVLDAMFDLWVRTYSTDTKSKEGRALADARRFLRNPNLTERIRDRILELLPEASDALTTAPTNIEELLAKIEHIDDPAQLTTLSTHPSAKVRAAVMGRNICPIETLEQGIKDRTRQVRRASASNPNLPVEHLVALYRDEDQEFVSIVLNNPSLPYQYVKKAIHGDITRRRFSYLRTELANMEFASRRGDVQTKELNLALNRFIAYCAVALQDRWNGIRVPQYLIDEFGKGLRRFGAHPNADVTTLRLVAENLPDEKGIDLLIRRTCQNGDYERYEELMEELAVSDKEHARTFALRHPATPEHYRAFGALVS